MAARVVVLTGASGSGKTTIAEAVAKTCGDLVDVFRFDEVGVPSPEEMVKGWGSAEGWQHATTLAWMERIAANRDHQALPVLLEGQMRIAFIKEGLTSTGIKNGRIVLVDCDDESRARRLTEDRRQPALANPTMMNWADHLRREARAIGIEVLDTTRMQLSSCVQFVIERLGIELNLR